MARLLVERFERSVLVEGDAFFGFVSQGWVEPWLPESDEQNDVVIRAAAAAAGRFASGGYATVYDGVVGPWFLRTFTEATGLGGLAYVMLLPPVERCLHQVASRVDHPFTDEAATRKMHQEFSLAAIDPRHVFTEVPDRPDAVVDLVVAALADGSLTYRA